MEASSLQKRVASFCLSFAVRRSCRSWQTDRSEDAPPWRILLSVQKLVDRSIQKFWTWLSKLPYSRCLWWQHDPTSAVSQITNPSHHHGCWVHDHKSVKWCTLFERWNWGGTGWGHFQRLVHQNLPVLQPNITTPWDTNPQLRTVTGSQEKTRVEASHRKRPSCIRTSSERQRSGFEHS